MKNISVVEQCIKWNAKRYDRLYDDDLTIALLSEENEELKNSKTIVDILDACGDITFVAIGALWKLGFSQKEIESLVLNADLLKLQLPEVHVLFRNSVENLLGSTTLRLTRNKYDLQDKVGYILGFILGVLTQLDKLKLRHKFLAVFRIIANSNDTKEVKKRTPPHIKANIIKGKSYVPPTKDLVYLLKLNDMEQNNGY